jgi:hypothetical protein
MIDWVFSIGFGLYVASMTYFTLTWINRKAQREIVKYRLYKACTR